MDTDFLLIQKMKLGDEQAIETFVHKYYPRILEYCHFHISDAGYAEDVTQETFENFFRTLGQYHHYGKAVNYLYVIAANACRDYYRKGQEFPVEELPEQPDFCMDGLETRIDVNRALACLPCGIRETAVLYFCQEIRQKEIAKILGISLPLVKYRIKKAREYISSYLGKEQPDDEIIR